MNQENKTQKDSEKVKTGSSQKDIQKDETLNKMKLFMDRLLIEIEKDINNSPESDKS